jgi:hypothetical protein
MMSTLSYLAVPIFFPHFLINGTIFERLLLNVCFDFLYNLCLKYFSSKEEFSDILESKYT